MEMNNEHVFELDTKLTNNLSLQAYENAFPNVCNPWV